MHRTLARVIAVMALATALSAPLGAWGVQGHRLVGLIAANHLTPIARRNVEWLLAPQSLADVSSWADEYLVGVNQTAPWHYVNIPSKAQRYDRDRDCRDSRALLPVLAGTSGATA